MKKSFIVLAILVTIYTGCEDAEEPTSYDTNETVPSDVPIVAPDANVSIDENLPPEPAAEG